MSPALRRFALPVALGLLTLAVTLFWRQFPPRLALLSSTLVTALGYYAVQAVERLSRIYRR